ncbi:MAG: Nif3-like dinuclear metal center hexameric protein, partial [Bacteroidales bacterium]|nr:Nif3-like dinuclear metal center hexameric protein [Bacteroidales bacterium]
LDNTLETSGAGMIGQLEKAMPTDEFLEFCKKAFNCQGIAYTGDKESIKKVAVCGGSGSFLIGKAASSKADAFITGDIKYHQFLDANKNMLLLDVGHFESEQFTPEIFYDIITEKFPTFAVRLSRINTNPVKLYT